MSDLMPCRCGVETWERPAKRPGRPPLASYLCPTCEAKTRRAFKAGAKRRWRDRERAKEREARS